MYLGICDCDERVELKPSNAIDTEDKVYLENYKHPEIELFHCYLYDALVFGIRNQLNYNLTCDIQRQLRAGSARLGT